MLGLMNKRIAAAWLGLGAASEVFADRERWQLNMTEGATETSKLVFNLHMQIFYICCVIGVMVFGAMFYAMFKFRKSKGAVPATWSHSTTAEVIWTVLPIAILVMMAFPATKVMYQMYDTGNEEMTVKVTGYQWLWRYDYLDEDVTMYSRLKREDDVARRLNSGQRIDPADPQRKNYLIDVDNRLILPTKTKIRFVITADDVIHAWWVPALGWKQDAVPGFINEAWTRIDEPGIYRGQCTELCGKDHGFMPIVIEAVDMAVFKERLAEMKAAASPLGAAVVPQIAQVAPAATTAKSFE